MKSFIQKIISFSLLSIFVFFTAPVFLYSAPTADTTSGKTGIVYECETVVDGKVMAGECDFNDLVAAVRKVINWGTIFALQFSVVVIAFAGFRYMKSGDNAGERTKANEMLRKVVIGIFFILTAWVIVTLVMSVLVDTGAVGTNKVPLLLN